MAATPDASTPTRSARSTATPTHRCQPRDPGRLPAGLDDQGRDRGGGDRHRASTRPDSPVNGEQRQGDLRRAAEQLRQRGLRRHRPTTALTNSVNTVVGRRSPRSSARRRWASTWSKFGFYEDPPMDYPDEQMVAERRVRRARPAAAADLATRSTSAAWRSARASCSSRRCRWRRSPQTVANGGVRMEPRLVAAGRRPRRAHGRRAAARGGRARDVRGQRARARRR